MQKCVACQFYDRNKSEAAESGIRWGQCRRTGPIVHPSSSKAYMIEGVWPHVRDDDWCGEFVAGTRRADSPAIAAMSSLMQSAAANPRNATVVPAFVATEPAHESAHPPITTLMRTQAGSD